MMKMNLLKRLIGAISITILMLFLLELSVFAGNSTDSALRIGLVYSKKPASIVKISSEKEITLGISDNGVFEKVMSSLTSPLSVMKDVYYSLGSSITATGSSGADNISVNIVNVSGSEVKSWHIRVDEEVSTYEEAKNFVEYYKNKGLEGYPYYNGKWSFITGYAASEVLADKYLKALQIAYPQVLFTVVSPDSQRILVLSNTQKPILAFLSATKELSVMPDIGANLSLETDKKRPYRGKLNIFRLSTGDFTVVNEVSVQEYLYGVVPAEIGGESPVEAIKAQAVAARNYAQQSRGKHSSERFDLCNTTDCQTYGGVNVESRTANKGVDETKDKLLLYNGQIASLFYYGSTGGEKTEDIQNVWGSKIPYLVSVENKYESEKAYNYTWKFEHTAVKVKEFLKAKGIDIGDIKDIQIVKRSDAGRAVEVKIFGSKGDKAYLKESIRLIFRLESQFFNITTDADVTAESIDANATIRPAGKPVMTATGLRTISSELYSGYVIGGNKTIRFNMLPTKYLFSGKGWGHSVGMSQEGAIGMAKAGFMYDDILTHFFPGTKIN